MKKIYLSVLLCVFSFISCEDENAFNQFDEQNDLEIQSIDSPLSSTKSTPSFDWENDTSITITNGQTVTLPWQPGAATNIPDYILSDYKKIDGWQLLYNFCPENIDEGKNYMIFYNIFTGTIRTYYYLANDVTAGNEGIWSLNLTGESALLNNVGYFAKPINQLIYAPISASTNISTIIDTKAFSPGWNCFDTEITYDPSAQSKIIKMSISPYDNNISIMTMEGSYNSKSEGTIITSGSTNFVQSLGNSVAKAAGNSAGNWVKNNVGSKNSSSSTPIKIANTLLNGIATGGTTAIVSAGINLVFGSFIGRFSQPTITTQKLEFKTNGRININGTITSSSASNVVPIANLYFPNTVSTNEDFSPNYNDTLGVWNIDKTPIVKLSKKAYLVGDDGGNFVYRRTALLDNSSFNVIMNPEVLANINNYEVSKEIIYYKKFHGINDWRGHSASSWGPIGDLIYKDSLNEFYRYAGEIITTDTEPDYPECYPEMPVGQLMEMPFIWQSAINNHYVVKVSVKLYPKSDYNTDPIVISRTYLPDYVLYNTELAPPFP